MIVLRVEHRRHAGGPYRGRNAPLNISGTDGRVDNYRHPTLPEEFTPDQLAIIQGSGAGIHGWRSGFADCRQLNSWFSADDFATLRESGYCAALYDVTESAVGRTQVLFRLASARRLVRLNLGFPLDALGFAR